MKKLLLLLFLFGKYAYGQQTVYSAEAIARMEMTGTPTTNFTDGTAASNNFDIKYYRCEWEVDPGTRYIKGKVTAYFKMTDASSNIVMDLASVLMADSIKQHGSLLSFTRPTNAISVNFLSTLNASTLDSISIWYHGVPGNTGFGSFIQDMHAGTPVIWTLSEAYGSRDWWPCKNGMNDKADSVDIFIKHPSAYKAASNGLLQYAVDQGNGTTVTYWKHRYPIASYLVCLAVTNYSVFNNSVQLGSVTLPMVSYVYPENLATFQANTPNVLEALQFYHNTFGDYPFIKEKYGHVQFGWGGGMEHQTSTFLISSDESLMAHELGHQWFGDKITCAGWEDVWLNEGFATYLANLEMQRKYGEVNYGLPHRLALVNNVTSLPGGTVKVDDTTSVTRIFSGRLSYNKGGHLLFMLQQILGDNVFFDALRQYQHDPAVIYGNAHTSDLKRNLEQISGRDLTYFFDQWYTGQGYPSYNVQWSMIGSSTVNIKLSQITSHPSVSFFQLPIPLQFKNATQSKTVIVDNTFNGQTFIRTLGFTPDTVLVDPEHWFLTKNNTMQKVTSTNTGAGIVDIYPNPATDPLTVYFHDFAPTTATMIIYNKAGQRMYFSNVNLASGSEYIQIPVSNWAHGTYIVKIRAGDKKIEKQILR
jgi:aminopeptidase N